MEGDSVEGDELHEAVLRHINRVLMEDDLEDKACMIQESTLYVAEKSLYEVLNEKDPPSPNQLLSLHQNHHEGTRSISDDDFTHISASTSAESGAMGDSHTSFHVENSSFDSNSPLFYLEEGMLNSFVDCRKGIVIPFKFEEKCLEVEDEAEKGEGDLLSGLRRGKKSLHREEIDGEGRSNKQLASDADESLLHELFDKALSLSSGTDDSGLNALSLSNGSSGEHQQNERAKGSDIEIVHSRKGGTKKQAVDARNLLLRCMQSVADNDHGTASGLLKQIRLLSSPSGNGCQRLAHYFANGLQARLLATGSPQYKVPLPARRTPDIDVIKAHNLFLSGLPFLETSYFFANQTIMKLAEEATSIHIIHFGIMYGVQWPPLIQSLSTRPGGAPKLRITGIDFPRDGFRPDATVKQTGCRLASFCEKLNVPFQYKGIARSWQSLSVEDLEIKEDEVIVVNCLYRMMHLLDDTVMENSPRDAVLKLIRRINPDVFIHCINNGSYNSPLFISRFREALFFFSSMFDMLDVNLPQNDRERMVFEEEICGKAILNVLASEGAQRLERPETYKQWQNRMVRAGLRQLPLNREIAETVRAKVKSCYHKDFFVEESSEWLVEGWKRRIMYAFSCWRAA